MVATLLPLRYKKKERQQVSNGRVIGHFRVEERLLGKGSSSTVRIGRHIVTGEKVAVKIINKSSKTYLKYLTREVHALKSMDHKNVVKFVHFGADDEYAYIIMEYLPNSDLCNYLRQNGSMDECTARGIFIQLCQAVGHVHAKHFAHHDLKLENILVDENKNIKLIDFGMSIYLPKTNMKVSQYSGTPYYMPPEILTHEPFDPKQADIWSLGVVLYQMVFNKRPYAAKDYRNLREQVCQGDLDLVSSPQLSPELADLLQRLMTKDPCKRIKLEEIADHTWVQHTC